MTTPLPEHPAEATLHADNTKWTLHLHRDLPQDPAAVWDAITKADKVAQWTPFRPDHDLVATGEVWLTPTDGGEEDAQGTVTEANAPATLTYLWGVDQLRFELQPSGSGTTLDFAHTFDDRGSAASFAAGWHLCLGALELLLAGKEVPSVVGQDAMQFGWEDLERQYAALFHENDDSVNALEPMEDL